MPLALACALQFPSANEEPDPTGYRVGPSGKDEMATGDTFKMIKLVGESSKGIEDAARIALEKSSESLHGHSWAHIVDIRANLASDGKIQAWQTTIEAGFKLDSE